MKPTQEELLKAVGDVLDEALAEYDKLVKGDGIEEAQVVSWPETGGVPEGEGMGAASNAGGAMKPSMSGGTVEAQQTPSRGIEKEDEDMEGLMDEDDEEMPEDDEDKEKEDEELMRTYKSVVAKMQKRGLMRKSNKPKRLTKSDIEQEIRAEYDNKFDHLAKSIKEVSEAVKMIAKTPAPRRGLAGYSPLKKSGTEGGESLRKSEVVDKLLDLKKSGQDVDALLINRIETNRASEQDVNKLRALGILGE